MLTVCCAYKPSRQYDDRYPMVLQNMVARHLSIPHWFVCLSNEDIPGVDTIAIPSDLDGWWIKLALFHPEIDLGDDCLFFDLDTVIIGDISDLLKIPGDFCALQSRMRRADGSFRMSSAVMRWRRRPTEVWTFFSQKGHEYDLSRDDQTVIWLGLQKTWTPMQEYLPKGFFVEWLYDSVWKYYRAGTFGKLFPNTRVICFGGAPKPHDLSEDIKLIGDNWR